MKLFENKNWGLKILALILALVIYYTLKDSAPIQLDNERKAASQH